MTIDEKTNWRPKALNRYEDPELVAVMFATGLREVFDYHEAICDLIHAAHRNAAQASLYTLARRIHDAPPLGAPVDEWEQGRARILYELRERGLVCFSGDVDMHSKLDLSVPAETYAKWHATNGKAVVAAGKPRDKKSGRFAKKESPQEQAVSTTTDHNTTIEEENREEEKTPHAPRLVEVEKEAFIKVSCDRIGKMLEPYITGGAAHLSYIVETKHRAPHPRTKTRLPIAAWLRAAEAYAQRAATGWRPDGNPIGYYIGMVPGCEHEVEAIEHKPKPHTLDDIMARVGA